VLPESNSTRNVSRAGLGDNPLCAYLEGTPLRMRGLSLDSQQMIRIHARYGPHNPGTFFSPNPHNLRRFLTIFKKSRFSNNFFASN
jgi:hypothetical protein